MRVIHIVECFAGGVFEILSALTQGLPENEYIIVHGKRKSTPKNYRDRFPKHTMFIPWESAQREISPWQDLKALLELIKLLKKYSTEKSVIHMHSSKAGFLGRVAAQLLGKSRNVLYTAHGAAFLRKDVNKGKYLVYVWLEKIAGYFGGIIVACSSSEGEEFKKYKIENVVVINNGIKIEKTEEISKKERATITIGTLARITYQKNPKQFNKIAKQYTENKNVKFLWIGDGELRDELESPNIEITGWLSKEEAKKRLKEIDIYLSTSLWEGLPLAVLEAMALGKTVVLSNCVGNRDLIGEKKEYSFSTTQEAIEKIEELLRDKKQLKWNEKSCELVKKFFSIQEMIHKYDLVYKNAR